MANQSPSNIADNLMKSAGSATHAVVALTDKGPLAGFKKFLSRGSMILNALINFLLIGVAVYFCVILPINKLRDLTAAQDEAEAKEEGPSVEEQTLATLQEIRDELKKSNGSIG